jgi:phosphoenolpyruvate carboxylase
MHKIRELKRWVGLYEGVKREIDDLEVTFRILQGQGGERGRGGCPVQEG